MMAAALRDLRNRTVWLGKVRRCVPFKIVPEITISYLGLLVPSLR